MEREVWNPKLLEKGKTKTRGVGARNDQPHHKIVFWGEERGSFGQERPRGKRVGEETKGMKRNGDKENTSQGLRVKRGKKQGSSRRRETKGKD